MQGALWRWDGYTVTAGAPTSAATRLVKRNRLEDMRVELHSSDANAANALSIYELSKTAARNAAAVNAKLVKLCGPQMRKRKKLMTKPQP